MFDRRGYWEKKILAWETSRYSGNHWLHPSSWTLRGRMSAATLLARSVLPKGGRVLELGCGSGLLAERLQGSYGSYVGIDLAENAIQEARVRVKAPGVLFERGDVCEMIFPEADLTVFLGLVDWLEPEELRALFGKIRSPHVLFSFTEQAGPLGSLNPYGLYRSYYDSRFGRGVYRAKSYSREEAESWLSGKKLKRIETAPALFFDPGRLVLAECEV